MQKVNECDIFENEHASYVPKQRIRKKRNSCPWLTKTKVTAIFRTEIERAEKILEVKFDNSNFPSISVPRNFEFPLMSETPTSILKWTNRPEFIIDKNIKHETLLMDIRHALAHIFEYQLLEYEAEAEQATFDQWVNCEEHCNRFLSLFYKLAEEKKLVFDE
jgi:hypothetical protein